jgi:hypothetical protein
VIQVALSGGGGLAVSASGSLLMGAGKLSNGAVLKVTGGTVYRQAATLRGVIVTRTGQVPFRLDADGTTGTVRFSYQGTNGSLYSVTGKGVVKISSGQ